LLAGCFRGGAGSPFPPRLRSSASTRRDVASTLVSPRSCAQGERMRRHKGGAPVRDEASGSASALVGNHATGRRVYTRQSQILRSGREDTPPQRGGRRARGEGQVLHLRSLASTRRDVASTFVSPRSCAQGERLRRHRGEERRSRVERLVLHLSSSATTRRDVASTFVSPRSYVQGEKMRRHHGGPPVQGRASGSASALVGSHATGRRVYTRQSQVWRSRRDDAPPPWGGAGQG